MIKKIAILFFVLIYVKTTAQTPTPIAGNWNYKGNVEFTGDMLLVNSDTIAKPQRPGAIRYKSSDKTFYGWDGIKFIPIVSSQSSIPNLQTVTANGNTTAYDILIQPGLGHSLDLSGSGVIFNQTSGARVGTFVTATQTANRTWYLPDASGTIALSKGVDGIWAKNLTIGDTTHHLKVDSIGSAIIGVTADTASMQASNYGTLITGYQIGGSTATVTGQASWIMGKGQNNTTTSTKSVINVAGNGCGFMGFSSGGTASIPSTGIGAVIIGSISRNTYQVANNAGSFISAYTTGTSGLQGAKVVSSGLGSHAFGMAQNTGYMEASGNGSTISAFVSTNGVDTTRAKVTANGSFFFGGAEVGSQVLISSNGGGGLGYLENNSKMTASGGHGAFTVGHTTGSTGFLFAGQDGSFAGGNCISDSVYINSIGGFGWGRNIYMTGNYSFSIGGGLRSTTDSTGMFGWGANTVTINGNSASTALVTMSSTTKGLLIPRMTTANRTAIPSPAEGLQLYNTTTHTNEYYNGSNWVQTAQWQQVRTTSDYNKTNNTTLTDIPGLSVDLIAGKSYKITANIYTTSADVTGGVKFSLGGTVVVSAVIYDGVTTQGTSTKQSRATSLNTEVGNMTTATEAFTLITGTITVGTGGTLTVKFAQNFADGLTSSVMTGSTLTVSEIQ